MKYFTYYAANLSMSPETSDKGTGTILIATVVIFVVIIAAAFVIKYVLNKE